jgi:poly-gamma-glutamate system protein
MGTRGFERRDLLLLVAAAILCAGYLGLGLFSTERKAPWHDEKLAASRLAQEAMAAIKSEKRARGIRIDKTDDINETGMIGQRSSRMTTTLGSLEAKRTSANPDFAAVAVELLKKCGAKKGDRIAVNLSGSFPALGLSVLSAMETLELQPVVIASLGASMWGANDPAFSWLDMEQVVIERRLIRTGLTAVSLGGARDVGQDMDDEVRESLRARVRAAAVPLIEEPDLGKNVARRTALYLAGGVPACFVNIGGNLASGGSEGDFGALRPGLLRSFDEAGAGVGGLIREFLARKVPVIHLLNLKVLAAMYGLPHDPVPQAVPGSGGVFRETRYSLAYIAVVLALGLAMCVAYVRSGKRRG